MNKPREEGDARPWEQPGAVRRDAEPNNAHLLANLGYAVLALGVLGSCGGFTAAVGLPLGAVVWVVARRELRKMQAGTMDPFGQRETLEGRGAAFVGMMLCTLWVFLYGVLFLEVFRW